MLRKNCGLRCKVLKKGNRPNDQKRFDGEIPLHKSKANHH